MSTHKHVDMICLALCLAILVVVSGLLIWKYPQAQTVTAGEEPAYVQGLFSTDSVHTIDIAMEDWDAFLETCENEEYTMCTVTIDGEQVENIAIRAKGNTSLSSVRTYGNDRYSFKLEFDQYESSSSYYGLDKLSLNNLIQDSTYMKDYLTYTAMAEFGVSTPLCSYVYVTVNGEDWGLYLAVEGVEDSFLERNYGSDYGELYKPDSMSFGGGRGNGAGFDMSAFSEGSYNAGAREAPDDMPWNAGEMLELVEPPGMGGKPGETGSSEDMMTPEGIGMPEGPGFGGMPEAEDVEGAFNMSGMLGLGASDVKLQYVDDNASSYSNIFDNAKTPVSDADKSRLIHSLEKLSEQSDLEATVDVEQVIRYFVVHNFVCNGDSYTGSMVHNYYLYEEDGRLSMIPWDYNLAFGTFTGDDATSAVNGPIDTPISGGDASDRPMFSWIVDNEAYLAQYHSLFSEFLAQVDMAALVAEAAEMIAPYVEKDPTAFYSYEEFELGADTLAEFCRLRTESVAGQLGGSIPSTASGQSADNSTLVDASKLDLSDMGSMADAGVGHGRGSRDGEAHGSAS